MKHPATLTMMLVLLGFVGAAPAWAQSAEIQRVLAIQDRGQCDQALTEWNRLLRRNPSSSDLQTYRGDSLRCLGRYQEALDAHNEALSLNERNPIALTHRGIVYWIFGRDEDALRDQNLALQIQPDFARAYNNRALIHESRGADAEALADYNRAVELEPDFDLIYANRGIFHFRSRNVAAAMADFNEAERLGNRWGILYAYRGRLHALQGNLELAQTDLRRAISIQPAMPNPHYDLGLILLRQDKASEAEPSLSQAIQNQFNPLGQAYLVRGIARISLGNGQGALADLQDAQRRLGPSADIFYQMGRAYEAAGQRDSAEAAYRDVLDLEAGYLDASLNLAAIQLESDPAAAEQTYTGLPQDDPRVQLGLASAQLKVLEASHAAENPPDPAALADLTTRFTQLAARLVEPSLQADAYTGLAKLADMQGDLAVAIQHAEQAVTLDPNDAEALANLNRLQAASR